MKVFLALLSLPYRAVIAARNTAYDRGWIAVHRIPNATIVSVGNIVAGGSGKTPVVMALAQALADEKIAILTRGYRSEAEKLTAPTVLTPDTAALCGDEPLLLATRLPQAKVFVGRDRVQSAKVATEAGCRILLLDDGLQHRRLARDFDIVVVDAEDPLGGEHLLPRGYLREPPSALRRASFVVITHVQSSHQYQEVVKQLASYTSAPTTGMRLQVTGVYPLADGAAVDVKEVKVGLFCGIAKPDKFLQTAAELKAEVVATLIKADHEAPDEPELRAFAERCQRQGAKMLLCTEKDKVKLDPKLALPLPIAWVKVDLAVVEDAAVWQQLIADIRQL